MKGYYLTLCDDTNSALQAALPVFEVKSVLMGHRLVSIPFATLCDPLISSNEDANALVQSANDLSRDLGVSHLEIRTLASCSLIQDDRLDCYPFYKHHYISLDAEPEQLQKTFHRTCVQQRIRRAIKSGLSLRPGGN